MNENRMGKTEVERRTKLEEIPGEQRKSISGR
jgi:hypothetical protein